MLTGKSGMRACLVSGEYPPMQGGVGDYTAYLAKHLADEGLTVAVATAPCAGVSDEPGNPEVWRRGRNWSSRSMLGLRRQIRGWCADIVHVQYQSAAYGLHPAVNLSRVLLGGGKPKLVVTFHDLKVPYLFPKAGALRRLSVMLLAATADAAITTNTADARALSGHWLGRRASNNVIPIGSNIPMLPDVLSDREAWRERLGVKADDLLLAYFGFLNESKGVDILLAAVAELLRRGRSVWLLMIGGTAGDSDPTNRAYATKMRSLADKAPLRGRVLWTGFVADGAVSAHLQASDLCALPFREGASYRHGTLIAAIQHGIPIVTTAPVASDGDAEGLRRLVHGENALLVPPGDVMSLVQTIERVGKDRQLLERLRQGATQLASQFAWPTIARQTIEVYERVLGGGK